MAIFQYTAQDSNGQAQSGTIEAPDRSAAISAIRANGLFPTGISEAAAGGGKAAPAAARAALR